MPLEDTVTDWIHALKDGDQRAAQQLWQHFVERLLQLARHHLGQTPRRAADEEDVVLSVFDGLCRGVQEGRFPDLYDRDDLWQILVMLTERKASSQQRRELAAKRGGGKVRGDSLLRPARVLGEGGQTGQFADTEPTPDFAAHTTEELGDLLERLNDWKLVRIAVDKLHGYTNEEIAERMDISLRSVERKLRLIRTIWEAEHRP